MSEELTQYPETDTIRLRRITSSGMVIECQTTVAGDSGLAERLSRQADEDVIVPPSVWHFMGPRKDQIAQTIARTVNLLIAQTPETKGRYNALCVDGGIETQTPTGTTVEPYAAVVITGYGDQTNPDEVAAFSYKAMKKMNELLESNNLGFQIPLPSEISQPQD